MSYDIVNAAIDISVKDERIKALEADLASVRDTSSAYLRQLREYEIKVSNVAGYIKDWIDTEGEISDDLSEIARMLEIALTKTITGEGTFNFSFTATVPLDFDVDDLDFSCEIECNNYDVEVDSWTIDNEDWSAEDD